MNYILFITAKTITDVNTASLEHCVNDYFAFKTSLTIFNFMKVELKY